MAVPLRSTGSTQGCPGTPTATQGHPGLPRDLLGHSSPGTPVAIQGHLATLRASYGCPRLLCQDCPGMPRTAQGHLWLPRDPQGHPGLPRDAQEHLWPPGTPTANQGLPGPMRTRRGLAFVLGRHGGQHRGRALCFSQLRFVGFQDLLDENLVLKEAQEDTVKPG